LELVPTTKCNNWAHLCSAVSKDTDAGIVASTHATRKCYWGHWEISSKQYQSIPSRHGSKMANHLPTTFCSMGQGGVQTEEDAKSKLVACKQQLAPSARPSNWLGLTTPCTESAPTSTMPPLQCKLKHTEEQTQ